MTQPTAAPVTVPAPRTAWTAQALAAAQVVVVAHGPVPGADACAVARELATRLDDGPRGRVALLLHTPALPDARSAHPALAPHTLGELLRSAAARDLDWSALQQDLAAERDRLRRKASALTRHGISVISGAVRLLPRGAVSVETHDGAVPRTITPQRIVLAPGSLPMRLDVPGADETVWYATDTVLDRAERPASVVVLGAGPEGCELAQGLARLGITVTLVEEADRPLPDLPVAAAQPVVDALVADGVRLLCGARVASVAPTLDGGAWVGTDVGGDVAAEALVLALGRRPWTAGLGLTAAGITLTDGGAIAVDEKLRTTVETVLACGEATGTGSYGCSPGPMARVAAANVVGRRAELRWSPPVTARVVRTDPEVVAIGTVDPATGECGASVEGPTPGSSVQVLVGPAAGRGLFGVRTGSRAGHLVLGAVLVGPGAVAASGQLTLAIAAGLPAATMLDVQAPDGSWAAAVQTCLARALTQTLP